MVKPRGHDHCARCCGSVQARNTSARGASNVRRIVSSRSATGAAALSWALAAISSLLALQPGEVGIEALEAPLPVAPIALGPVRHLPQRPRLEPARPRLRPAAADDEPGPLEHLQMLRDRRLAHAEGLRELHHARLPAGEAGEDRAARRVGECGEGLVEAVGRHAYKTIWLYNRRVFNSGAVRLSRGRRASERSSA